MNNPPDFILQFRRTVWRRDYPFQIACVQPPPPLRKNRRRGVCGEGATVHRLVSDGWSISSSSVKTANNKIPVSSVFNDSEGLYRTTVCRCLVHRPHYSARLMLFGSRGPSEFATEMSWPRLRGNWRRRTGTRHGNVYHSVREKQGIVTGNCCSSATCLTVTSPRVVSLVFRGHNLLKITNINPQQEARFSLWKKLGSSREWRK